ncbi:MAG: septal ring lytic transglycosylase RlpA family protein [Actinomycetota bacterium]|nr:septal ring lytic transglycosylase RlpA family protein [Actinomycetota bacterium]
MRGRRVYARVLTAAVLVAMAASTLPRAATAADISELRRRAQALGDEVSALEHKRAGLVVKSKRLSERIENTTVEIGSLELEIHEANAAVDDARERYIERAIEAYKSGSTTRLALLLSARSLGELVSLAETTMQVGAADGEALAQLIEARDAVAAAQDRVDEHKQSLLAAQAQAQGVKTEIDSTIVSRRELLAELNDEIATLEAQARAAATVTAAAQGISVGDELLKLLEPSGPAPDIPDDFVSTGVSFEGIASWYGPGFEGNHTANGDIFDSSLYTAASKELPLGSWLHVQHQGKGVVVLVNDRGPYVEGRILDLSQAAAASIGITGLGWVKATIIIKK